MNERPLYTLYKNLKSGGYEVPDSYDRFENAMTRKGKEGADNRHAMYDSLKEQDYDVPDTYERFYSALFQPVSRDTSRAIGGSVPMSDADKARFTSSAQAAYDRVAGAVANTRRYGEAMQRQRKAERQRKNFGRVDLGAKGSWLPGKVVRDDNAYNAQTGRMGTYLTSGGMEFGSAEAAGKMQEAEDALNSEYLKAVGKGEIASAFDVRDKNGNYDLQENVGSDGTKVTDEGLQRQYERKLQDAYARKAEIEEAIAEEDRQNGNARYSYSAALGAGNSASDDRKNMDASLRQVEHEIDSLEAVTGAKNKSWLSKAIDRLAADPSTLLGKTALMVNGYLGNNTARDIAKGLGNTAGRAETWDLGLSDLALMGRIENIRGKMKRGMPLTASEKQLLDSKIGADAAAALEDEKMGAAYRWAKIAGESLPFMLDFAMTGGYSGLTRAAGKMALKTATKMGMKGLGKTTMKYLGVAVGDVAGSVAMSATTQAAKTASDIMQRNQGQLYRDADGSYKFGTFDENGNLEHEGGETMGKAVAHGLAASAIENYTEKMFGHTHFKRFLGKKMAGTKIGEVMQKFGQKGWYADAKRTMKKLGIDGYFEEVMEEEVGIPLNALLVGDNKMGDLLDMKQQGDILGGMAFSVGSLAFATGGGKAMVRQGQYYRFKHKVNSADRAAYDAFGDTEDGRAQWEAMRDRIDGTPNEDMGQVFADIVAQRDRLSKEQINAAVRYGNRLMTLRGYDYAQMEEQNARNAAGDQETEQERRDTEHAQAYAEGHEADDSELHGIQAEHAYDRSELAARLGITEEQLAAMDDEALEKLTGEDDALDLAIYDYQVSRDRYQGVVDNAGDNIELAGEQAARRADLMTDRATGTVRTAMAKGTDGEQDYQVYVVSGRLAAHDDGTVDLRNSDGMILYYNPKSGSIEHADATWFSSVGETMDAGLFKAQAVQEAQDEATKRFLGIINELVGEGMEFTARDDEGREHTYEVLADNGDGTAMITLDGNVVDEPVDIAGLQQLKDGEDRRTLAEYKAQRTQELDNTGEVSGNAGMGAQTDAQQKQEEERNARQSRMLSEIIDDDGNVVTADVEGDEDADSFIVGEYNNKKTGVKKYKVVTLNADGSVSKPRFVDASKVNIIDTMPLDEYRQALDERNVSVVEDNRGDMEGNVGGYGYTLSEQTAGNGERFYQDENGNIDMAVIPDEVFDAIGYAHAPFRLTPSMLEHIKSRHGKETGITNDSEAIDFVLDVLHNFDHVRLGYDGALVFSVENGRNRTGKRAVTVLINSNNGEFYGVKTSGYESLKGLEKRPLLWERGANETSSTDAATASVTTNESQLSSGQSGSASHQSNSLDGKDTYNSPDGKGNGAILTLEDGTVVPVMEDGNPDWSQLTARQAAELYDGQFGEDADGVVSGRVNDAKKALGKANSMTVKGKGFLEQKASKTAKDKAIADAQAAYDLAVAIRDAYNERQLRKKEDTPEGRQSLIESARRKYARMKGGMKDDAASAARLYNNIVGSLLHRLYDGTGIDVTDDTPQTVEEYVASGIAPYSLNYEGTKTSAGVRQETGLSREDLAQGRFLASEGKGETIDRLVQRLWDGRPGNLENMETQDIRNAVLDILTSGRTAFELKNYIQDNRIAEAENALEQEKDAAENARMAEEDYRGYMEGNVGSLQPGDIRPLEETEADAVIREMEANAETAPQIELTPDNWIAEFGEDGVVSTPIGDVKMGENQIAKLFEKGRSKEFGMIKPTLENPDVIIEEPSSAADGNEERSSSYLFIKTFLGKNGEKVYYFKSVTIKKDGLEISISSHYDRAKRVKDSLMKGKLLYRKYDGAQTEQNQPSASVTTSREDVAGSSDGKDTDNSSDGNENNISLTLEDGTAVPILEDNISEELKAQAESLGMPLTDSEGKPVNEWAVELAKWAKAQGLDIDPASQYTSYADLYIHCKDGYGVATLVPDRGENVNQVFYFPDQMRKSDGTFDFDRLDRYEEEFNQGRDRLHSADLDSELTDGATFYDAKTAREFRKFLEERLAEEDRPFGEQLEDVPFSLDGREHDGQERMGKEERAAHVELNRVDDLDVVDDIIGKKMRKALQRIAKRMGVDIRWQYSDREANGWMQDVKGEDGKTHKTVFLTLDGSIREGVQFVFGHEMTHAMKEMDDASYEEFRRMVTDMVGKKDFEAAVDERKRFYESRGVDYGGDRSAFEEEAVADAIGRWLDDLNMCHSMSLRLSHPLLAKIHEAVRAFKTAFYGTEYSDKAKAVMRTIEQVYVKTANGEFESSATGERYSLKDEEKAKRIEKLRESKPVEITGNEYKGMYELNRESAQRYLLDNLRGDYTIKDTGEVVSLAKKGAKKVTAHSMGNEAHLKSIAVIPQLIENSIFIEEQPAYKDDAKFDSYRYYVTGLKIGGEDYTARLTIGVKNGKSYYDHYLTHIEKGNLIDLINQSDSQDEGFRPTEGAPNTSDALYGGKDTKLLEILQTNRQENDENVKYSLRQKPEPTKKGIGYKVFVLKDGKLYPPMVANPNGAETPVGVWLDADAAPIAGESKTGRPQVKQGGKGTQGGSGKLAYRPGWHLGVIPYALQFNRKDAEGNKTLFPKNFVFAEVEYAADVDYQDEAYKEGVNANGKYQHSLAGLKHLPTDGYYMYRTNPNPETDPWVITGAMKVNRLLTRKGQAELVRNAGREPQVVQDGDTVTDDVVNSINQQIANTPKFSLRVYHGSGADFTEFDFDHMGEGAGSQVFGWGGYVTSSEEIGKSYAELTGTGKEVLKFKGVPIEDADINLSKTAKSMLSSEILRMHSVSKGMEELEKLHLPSSLQDVKQEVLNFVRSNKETDFEFGRVGSKNLYEVNIPDDNGSNYLDWDNLFMPKEQAETIDKGLSELSEKTNNIDSRRSDGDYFLDGSGEMAYGTVGYFLKRFGLANSETAPKAASQFLSSIGFTGIKYKAGRNFGGAEEGDTNYVIFKPEDMQIVEHTKFSLKSNSGKDFGTRLKSAVGETDTNPTDAQKENGNYKKGHVRFGGYNYTIENPKGSTRSGKDADGKEWKITMHDTYGYIRGKWGKDGDHLDMFINDGADLDSWNGDVYVVDQKNSDGSFDEHKVMYGYDSMEDARKAYLANYSRGWKGLGNITGASKEEFDKWLGASDRKLKPFADYAKVKFSQAQSEEVDNHPMLGAIHTLYTRGKEFASKLFNMKYFDVAKTPDFMKDLGLTGDKFTVRYGVMSRHFGKDGSHNFTEEEWRQLPDAIKNPFAISKLSDKKAGYRIYTTLKTGKGEYVVVGADVKNAGRNLEVNSIATIFGRRNDGNLPKNEEVIYKSKKITPEQMALLSQPNSDQYPSAQELSAANISNSFETAKENGKKFSIKEEKTMFGMHNISLDKLRKVIRQGGFAAPSMGVVDSKKGIYSGYGEITLIPKAEKIAKRTGKNIGTYAADAWSPIYPPVEKKFGGKGGDVAYDDIESVPKEMQRLTRNAINGFMDGRDADGLAYLYLQEKGKAPKLVHVEGKYPKELHDEVKRILGKSKGIYDTTDEQKGKLLDVFVREIYEGNREEFEKDIRDLIKKDEDFIKQRPNSSLAKNKQLDVDWMNEHGYDYGALSRFVDGIQRDAETSGKVDDNATMGAARKYIEDNSLKNDFEAWKEGLDDRYKVEEVIFAGYKADGTRKYLPNTVENAVKVMKQEGKNASVGSASFSHFIASILKPMGTLDQIRKKKGNLTGNYDDVEKFREKWQPVYDELSDKMQPDAGAFESYGMDRLEEVATQKNPKKYAKEEYGVDLTDEDIKKLNELVDAVKDEKPSIYFETKFMRPYGLDEFEMAVVPKDTPKDVVDALKRAGVDVRTYEGKEDREAVTLDAINSSDDIRFSLKKVNDAFNQRLDELVRNPNQKDKVLRLGRSSSFLKAGGIVDADIELEFDKFVRKSGEKYKNSHPFDARDLKNLPMAIAEPIAVFNSTNANDHVVLTELQKDGKNFIVAIRAVEQHRKGGVVLEVNQITSLYPKEEKGIINWINTGRISNVDKEKALHFIEALQPHAGTTINSEELNSAANIIKSFETAKESGEKFSIKEEKESIVAAAKADGTYMKAPNGRKTKLDAEQWANVRTRNFKKWFGDWEKDPKNASKVVDENGEPMVVYHGRSADFNTFEKKTGQRGAMGITVDVETEGFFFSPDRDFAEKYARNAVRNRGGKANVIPCFLNIKNPVDFLAEGYDKKYEDLTGWDWQVGMDRQDNIWEIMDNEGMADKMKAKGYDGAIFAEELDDEYEPVQISYCALDANQIKSADSNNGEYSEENDDIRYSLKDFGTDIVAASDMIKNLMSNETIISRRIGSRAQAQNRVLDTISKASEEYRRNNRASARSGQDTWEKDRALGYVVQASYGTQAFLTEEEIAEIVSDKVGSGYENQVYASKDGKTVFKLNNLMMVDREFRFNEFVDRIKAHNEFAPEDMYVPIGFALNYEGDFCIVLEQPYVDGAVPATQEEIDGYMRSHGFILEPILVGENDYDIGWSDGELDVWDTKPRNVLKDKNGDLHFIDTVIQHKNIDRHDDKLRFSLRKDRYEDELNQWKRENNLPKDAERPAVPVREPNETAADFLKRVKEYRRQMALWKTAPKYEGHLLSDDTAQGQFNLELQKGSVLARIAMQDAMLPIRKAQEAIMKEAGIDRLNMAEDAYTAENRSHGKSKNEFEEYNDEFLQPLRKAYSRMMKNLDGSYDNVKVYMMAKHGLERNAHMAFKKALEDDYEKQADRIAAYKAYKGDIDRLANDSDFEIGKIDFATWRRNDNAVRLKYAPSYLDYRYDGMGITQDYSGLSALFDGSDFEEAAAGLVKDVEAKYKYDADELWYATNAATKKILRDGWKAGMMSEEVYEYVRGMYRNYIPLRGWGDTNADQVWNYMGGGKGAFNQTLKEAHGRSSLADDPIAYIENMAESGILINNKNWVKQHLLLLAENHPTSLLNVSKAWYIKSVDAQGNEEWIPASPQITAGMTGRQVEAALDAFRKKMEAMEANGDATQKRGHLEISYPQTKSEEREHEVRVMRDGEEYVVYVNGDPQLAQAMNNTRAMRVREKTDDIFNRTAARLGRWMSAVYTSLSPLFVPSNYFRDLTMTLASTAIREDARYNYLLRKNLLLSWNLGGMLHRYGNGELREKVRSGTATEKERMFYDFMMNGGETGFVSSMDIEDMKRKLKNELKDIDRWKYNPKKIGHRVMDVIEFLNRAIEDSNRFAIYMTSIQYGRSMEEAVNNAKDVTLNFNRKGTGENGWQWVRNMYLFINPAVQSLQTIGALAKHHPVKFTAVTASWMAAGLLTPIVNAVAMSLLGGDDDKDKYWSMTKWDRRNNFVMYVGGGNFVKIPLAQEFRCFYGLGDMIASKLMGGEKAEESWEDYGWDLLGQVVDMLPLDPTGYDGNMAVSLMPNCIRPVFELAFNVDFTGKPIFKDSDYNRYDPNFTKAYAGTPDWLVRISRMVNSVGNDYPDVRQNAIDSFGKPNFNLNNPAVADHVLSSYLGGAYTLGSQVIGALTKALNDPKEFKMADVPFVSKFVVNPADREVKSKDDGYWTTKERHDIAGHTLNRLKQKAKADGDYTLLGHFYNSDEYRQYKADDAVLKKRKADDEAKAMEATGEEMPPKKLTADKVYKAHATPQDDFEDMQLQQLKTKAKGYADVYDGKLGLVDRSYAEQYYNDHKAIIDAYRAAEYDLAKMADAKKSLIFKEKDVYTKENMGKVRESRRKALAQLLKIKEELIRRELPKDK